MRRGLMFAVTVGIAALAGCAQGPTLQAIDRLTPCTGDDTPTDAYCGTLRVFENRETKQGRQIDLNIVVLPALGADSKPDPVFFLAGGPGQGAAQMARVVRELFRRVQTDRAVSTRLRQPDSAFTVATPAS